MTKSELRRKYHLARKDLVEKDGKDLKIVKRFLSSFSFIGNQLIHIYIPIEKFNEINTTLLIDELQERKHRIIVPKISGNELQNIEINPDTEWQKNDWGVNEPSSGIQVLPQAIDMVIVPLLAYDKSGFRVGYGKGFYDRFLKQCRQDCLKVGLSYFPPEEKIEHLDEWDLAMDYCVTPETIYEF